MIIKRLMYLSILILILFIASEILIYLNFNSSENQITPEISYQAILTITPSVTIVPTISVIPTVTPTPTISLKQILEPMITGEDATYGVVVRNLSYPESYYYNEYEEFQPASLYKLWVMAAVYQKIQNGELDKDQTLSQNVQNLNSAFHIDPSLAEQTEGNVSFAVSDALESMIEYSNNYAALLLSYKVRNSYIEQFLKDNEFNDSDLGEPPKTTAYDIAQFFQKLYDGVLANKENTVEMMDILEKQTVNHKIPKYLPKNTVIAHKTGELNGFSHDAGIVWTDKGNYIIVILTESEDPESTEDNIAKISETVFRHFNGI